MYLQGSGLHVVAIIKSREDLVHYASEVVICAGEDRESVAWSSAMHYRLHFLSYESVSAGTGFSAVYCQAISFKCTCVSVVFAFLK